MGDKTEEGVCLFHKKRGEKDLECGFFSPLSGLMYIKIVSALKSSKLYLPLCSEARVYLGTTSNASMYVLKDVMVEKLRSNIVEDYDKISVFSLLAKALIHFGAYDRESSYSLFITAANAIDRGVNPYFVFAHTIEKFFVYQGISGDYEACPHCGKDYDADETLGYSKEHNCSCCEDDANIRNVLSPKLREYLKATQDRDIDELLKNDEADVNIYRLAAFECFRLSVLNGRYFKEIDGFLKSMRQYRGGMM